MKDKSQIYREIRQILREDW